MKNSSLIESCRQPPLSISISHNTHYLSKVPRHIKLGYSKQEYGCPLSSIGPSSSDTY